MRHILAVILAAVLVTPASYSQGRPGPRAVTETDLRQEVLAIASGSAVELRLTDNSRLRGQLGAISDTDFEVRVFKGGVLETQRIRFDRLKSIRDKSRPSFGPSVGRNFAVTGIVVGVVIAVLVLIGTGANN